MFVRDTMTPKPITITAQESLQGAMELMAMKRIRHLPVVDENGALIGLVTDRDLRRAAPSPLFPGGGDTQAQLESTTVERVMIRAPTTIAPTAKLEDAVRLFVDKKFGALPVLEGTRLVGILTPIDVMRHSLKTK
ncbi:MAG: CBS domain-containing protein [Myxococcota bacterium]